MSLASTLQSITAQAGGSAAGGENALMGMLPIILMFVILYFLMIRPQMKRQKDHRNMVSALSKGDEVITSGGVLGKVTKVGDNYITVEIGSISDKPVEAVMQKTAVTSVLPKGTIKAL
jgi:preprotein translocase subunit YajC